MELAARVAGEGEAGDAPPSNEQAPRQAASFDEETRALIASDAGSLPATPPSAVEANFARYFVAGKRMAPKFTAPVIVVDIRFRAQRSVLVLTCSLLDNI
jgi:hypothetical protein